MYRCAVCVVVQLRADSSADDHRATVRPSPNDTSRRDRERRAPACGRARSLVRSASTRTARSTRGARRTNPRARSREPVRAWSWSAAHDVQPVRELGCLLDDARQPQQEQRPRRSRSCLARTLGRHEAGGCTRRAVVGRQHRRASCRCQSVHRSPRRRAGVGHQRGRPARRTPLTHSLRVADRAQFAGRGDPDDPRPSHAWSSVGVANHADLATAVECDAASPASARASAASSSPAHPSCASTALRSSN